MKNRKAFSSLRAALLSAALFAAPLLYANNLPFAHDESVKNAGASGALSPFISGALSTFVNPAGLGLAPRQEISGMYYNLFIGSLSSVSYAYPFVDAGTIGVSMLYYGSGDIAGLDTNNQPSGSAALFESYIDLSLAYGISLLPYLSAGATVKYLSHTLAASSGSAYGLDLGAVALLPYDMRLSLFLENAVKPEIKYASAESDALPVYFDATLAGAFPVIGGMNDSLKAGAGLTKEEYSAAYGWHAGLEYSVYDGMAALRGGINESGFSFGGSLSYAGATFDYAYVKTAYDFIQKFSLSYAFGRDIRALERELGTKEDKLKYALVQKIREDELAQLKTEITNSLTAGNAEAAHASVEKALVWSPGDGWFMAKEQEINSIINKDKKERLLVEADKMMKENSYIDALVALKNAVELDPTDTAVREKLDSTSKLVKATSEKNLFQESLNKDSIQKYFETGLDFYASGEYEKAIREWDNVIQASPLQRQVYEFISKAKEKVNREEDQAKNIEILKQQKISGLYNQAVILHTQGKFEESIGVWKQLLELDPANKEAKEYLNKVTDEYKKTQRQNLGW